MSYEIQHNFATNDAQANHFSVDANQKGATDALQKQVQETQFGFLNGMTTAMGGTASRPAEKDTEPKDQIKPKDLAVLNHAVAFGLANDAQGDGAGKPPSAGDIKKLDQAVAETSRFVAFESVYANAMNNPRNQSGMPGRDGGNPSLDWKSAPQMAYQGQALQFAKTA
jgi:hypothetical protein